MELTRKPFLINKALNKFLMASVFSAVAIQLAVMIDAIIVANFIGPDAMSAINVCTPVVAIIVNVGYMVSMGSTLLAHLFRFLHCRLCQDLSASLFPARPSAALHL